MRRRSPKRVRAAACFPLTKVGGVPPEERQNGDAPNIEDGMDKEDDFDLDALLKAAPTGDVFFAGREIILIVAGGTQYTSKEAFIK